MGALLAVYDSILVPAFTYQTMVTPKKGPDNNGVDYRNPPDCQNATFFKSDLPPSPKMGELLKVLLEDPRVARSHHPILSFAGINVTEALEAQTLSNPFAPIEVLVEDQGGWVLLLGADQTANISIHYAEQLAGRKQFIRWALTPAGIKECPNIPGCSRGFNVLARHIQDYIRKETFDTITITATPLQALIPIARKLILDDSEALLCHDENCMQCVAVKRDNS